MNKLWLVISSILIVFSCTKEDVQLEEEPLLLSETIIGEWEIKGEVDPMEFGDLEWHDLSPPYTTYIYNSVDTLSIYFRDGRLADEIPYFINDQDSLIYYYLLGLDAHEVDFFDKNQIDFFRDTREGPTGKRLIRKE